MGQPFSTLVEACSVSEPCQATPIAQSAVAVVACRLLNGRARSLSVLREASVSVFIPVGFTGGASPWSLISPGRLEPK